MRVTIFKNGRIGEGHVILCPNSLKELLAEASEVLGINGTVVYAATGGRFSDVKLIREDDVLYISEGEPFQAPNTVSSRTSTNNSVCINQRPHHNDWVTLNVGGKHFTTTRHKFLLEHNKHCKLVVIENENPNGVTRKELMAKAISLFEDVVEDNFFLQRWETGVGDGGFVDIDGTDAISGGVKIRVQLKSVQIIPVQLQKVSPVQVEDQAIVMEVKPVVMEDHPVVTEDRPVEIEENPLVIEEQPIKMEDQPLVMEDQPAAEQDEGGIEDNRVKSRKSTNTMWAASWRLPDFPPEIHHRLLTLPCGNDLKTGERTAVFQLIFNSVIKCSYYPKPAEYQMITEQLFLRYPKLGQQSKDITFGSQKELYKKRLVYYFQNARDALKTTDSVQTANFRKRKSMHGPSHSAPKVSTPSGPPVWGVANYLPPMLESEDENSIKRYIKMMQDEKMTKHPDIKRVNLAMDATLSDRREMIVQKHAKVEQIAEVYPWLFEETQLLSEMERLIGDSDKGYLERMKEGFSKFGMAIVTYGRQLKAKSTPQCFKDLVNNIPVRIQRNNEEYQDAVTKAAIVMIPTMFRENITSIFQSEEQDDMISPVIRCNDRCAEATVFETVVDGKVVTTSTDLVSAFYCYMACIYAFNLFNPKPVAKSTLFVEKVILQLEDGQSVQPLQTIVSKLINLL